MIHINHFGRSFVVDKETRIVLLKTRSNEIAKFVTSSILDSLTAQFSDEFLSNYDQSLLSKSAVIRSLQGGGIVEFTDKLPNDILIKKTHAELRARGYYLLAEQATIIGSSYDNLSDLSTDDLPMYTLNKELYAQEFATHTNRTLESAKKHLEFLSDSLLAIHMRKQVLMWRFGNTLKQVKTEDEYKLWKHSLLNSTIYIGQV